MHLLGVIGALLCIYVLTKMGSKFDEAMTKYLSESSEAGRKDEGKKK